MKIADFGSLQMIRTEPEHFGNTRIQPVSVNKPGVSVVTSIKGINGSSQAASIDRTVDASGKKFEDYLMEAVNSVNSNQLEVSSLQQKLITNPDEVDVHDVTIAMSKARMSLNLAQTVIDRLVTDWNEISTTR